MSKIPPSNIEAEQSVLGAMLMDRDAIVNVIGKLMPSHFYENRHGIIFEAMHDLFEGGMPVDIVTLCDKLKTRGDLKKIGGKTYLVDLVSSVPTSAHAEEYAQIVRDNAMRRSLISSSALISEYSFDEGMSIADVIDRSEQLLFGVAQNSVQTSYVHIKDLLDDAVERAQVAASGELTGVSTGFKELDSLLGGFQKSDMVILAARPSVGKTSLALDFMKHAAMMEKKKVLFFSLEMGRDQIIDRMIGMASEIPFWEIKTGRIPDEKSDKLANAIGHLSECEIFIDDKPGQTITEIRTKCRRLAMEQGVDIIFVDYLQLVYGHNKESRTQEVAEISRGLKNIARELKVPVIALSQLSRAIEQRAVRRPQLSDLRESGSIEQDADVVMFVDREEQWNPDSEKKGIADLFVAKHRNGPTGLIEMAFVKEIASFRNLYKGEKK